MNLTITVISFVSILLVMAGVTLWISRYLRIPFTILLVISGYLLSHLAKIGPAFVQPFANYKIDPDIILYACLPTLIFESAFTMDAKLLRRDIVPVLTLAIPGLFLSTAVIGAIIWLVTPIDFLVALLLGAILSATDPVAVIALFKQLGVPKRLTILVEGESLLNDSTAIVTAKTILFIMLAGSLTSGTVAHGLQQFCEEFFGGIAVGFVMALAAGYMVALAEEETVIGLSLTVILAYLSFIVADKMFHVSGVMATITAGIMMAGWGRTKLSTNAEKQLRQLLEFLSYIANALIFLMVGFTISLVTLADSFGILCITILAMLISRALVIFGLIPVIGKLPNAEPIDLRYQTIMWWGGLRGAIALAIVLSLSHLPDQKLLEALVTGSVLFTILAQGLTIHRLIKWMKLDRLLLFDRFAKLEAELSAEQAALSRIPELHKGGLFSLKILQALQSRHEGRLALRRRELDHLKEKKLTSGDERRLLYLRCFSVEKNLYYEMYGKGHLSEQAYRNLSQDVELEMDMMRYHSALPEKTPVSIIKKITLLFIKALESFPFFDRLAEKFRISQTINDYEETWGLHQGCVTVLNYLHAIEKIESIDKDVLNEVRACFCKWHAVTTRYLDEIAEQFPEFVNDMQRRLGSRLLLHAKLDKISDELRQGVLPPGVSDSMIQKYEHRIRLLRRRHPEKLKLDPHELVQRVPFLQLVPADEIDQLIRLFEERHVPSGMTIIHEGAVEDTFYLIMRGVVRVMKQKDNGNMEIATLIAGDFFGEMSLLYNVKRTASCKTVTPCLFYLLHRRGFDRLIQRYPQIKEAIDTEAKKRGEHAN